MIFSLEAARDNVRNRNGKRVFYLGNDDKLTWEARDYLRKEGIEVLPAQTARPERYRLESGGYLEEKPEHMTHLNAEVLVPKTHPRIAFRGKMDTLEAELILCQLAAEHLVNPVGEILALARQLIRCDVLDESVTEGTLCGLTESEIRTRSHFPQRYYDQPHFMPGVSDGAVIARLNRARCAAREAEVAAVAAFADREGNPTRVDILRAMNRMSSMLYILMIRCKSRK